MPSSPRQAQFDIGGMFGRPPPATLALMVATGVASIAAMAGTRFGAINPVRLLLDFSPSQVLDSWKVWTPFTYLLLAGDPFDLLLYEVLGLWMFASRLEQAWGPRRFLYYFFATGTGAALVTTALAALFTSLRLAPPGSFSGTTVAIDAILLGWVLMNWNATVYLLLFPVRAPYLLLFTVALPLLKIVQGFWEPFVPVMTGMAIGFMLLRRRSSTRRTWLRMRAWWIDRQLKRRARHLRVVPPPDRPQERKEPPQYLH
jgi:membrane associated rhomboid family serine protease